MNGIVAITDAARQSRVRMLVSESNDIMKLVDATFQRVVDLERLDFRQPDDVRDETYGRPRKDVHCRPGD